MRLTIDPDVFLASQDDKNCYRTLEEIAGLLNTDCIEFYLGENIVSEYADILAANPDYEKIEGRILGPVLSAYHDGMLKLVNENLPSSKKALLSEIKCFTPIEPQLIGLAFNAGRGDGKEICYFYLLLSGPGIKSPRLRARSLFDRNHQHRVKKDIYWVEIHFANEAIYHTSILGGRPNRSHLSRIYEGLVNDYIYSESEHLDFYTQACMPTDVTKKDGRDNQVDIYFYLHDKNKGDTRKVIIGECKLRVNDNERSKPIDLEERDQLIRKLNAAADYERGKVIPGNRLEVFGYLISNAEDMEEGVWDFIENLDKYRDGRLAPEVRSIEFLRITPESSWKTKVEWGIADKKIIKREAVRQTEDGIEYRLVAIKPDFQGFQRR